MRADEKERWLAEDSVLMMLESKDEKMTDSLDENWVVLSEDWKIVMKVGWTVWKMAAQCQSVEVVLLVRRGNPECCGCADGSLLGRL
jgi:hypothetical protein